MNIDTFRLLDTIDQYVYCKDKSGVYIYANNAFALIAGCITKEDVIGKTDQDLIWREEAKEYEACDSRVLKGQSLVREEQVQLRKNGSARIIISKKPYISDAGEIVGIVGNFFDTENSLILETKGEYDQQRGRLYLGFTPEWLSFAEVKICFYLIHGFSAPKIADKTGISISTVRYHIDNIKNKMQCSNKCDIASVAMKTGIAWKILSLQHVGDLDKGR